MSDRRLRTDHRQNHVSSQQVTRRRSGPVKKFNEEEIAALSNSPSKQIIVSPTKASDDYDDIQTVDQLLETVSKTVAAAVRSMHGRRTQLVAADIDSLDKAAKLLLTLKKAAGEDTKAQDVDGLLERALKIPELRDRLATMLQPQHTPQVEVDGDAD